MFAINEVIDSSDQREGIAVNIVGNEVTIWISYLNPEPEEIENFNKSPFEIGVGFGLGTLVFAYKIGDLDWQDLLYSYQYSKLQHRLGNDIFVEPSIEYLTKDEPLNLKMYFFDAGKKQVIGKRTFLLPETLKNEIIEGFKIQKYNKVPILHTSSDSVKIQAFESIKEFLENQPVDSIVAGLKKHIFNI